MSNTTFAADDLITDEIGNTPAEVFVYLGSVDSAGADVAVDFGGGTILICKLAGDGSGNYVVLKEITSIAEQDEKGSRFILPPKQQVAVILAGSTNPDLYAEIQVAPRRNP